MGFLSDDSGNQFPYNDIIQKPHTLAKEEILCLHM